MRGVQEIVGLGHSLRKENKLKVRQPLSCAHVVCADREKLAALQKQKHLIADELNVKAVEFHTDETRFVTVQAKPNFRILGKKVGSLMNATQKEVQKLSQEALKKLLKGEDVEIVVEGTVVVLTSEDVATMREVKSGVVAATGGDVTIALDTELNEDLILEGIARELVNKINTARKEKGFAVTDRIDVKIKTEEEVKRAFEKHRDYICHETLTIAFDFTECEGEVVDINGHGVVIALQKVMHKG
jgi:isoleucyl-tRNA synthetase